MKILVISTNRNQFPVPVIPVGACMVSESVEKTGHEVRLLDLMFKKDPLKAVRRELANQREDSEAEKQKTSVSKESKQDTKAASA